MDLILTGCPAVVERRKMTTRTAKSDAKGAGPCFRSKVEQNGGASSPKNGPDPDFAVLLGK
jgi:hypothetical protein